MEIDLANPPVVSLESVMVVTRGSTKEALAKQVGLLRRTEIMAFQPSVLEGYTPYPKLSKVINSCLGICSLW